MSAATINGTQGLTKFNQDVSAIEQALASMQQRKLPQEVDAMQKGLECVYSDLERLEISADLLLSQSRTVNEKGVSVLQGSSEDPKLKVQQLRQAIQAVHVEMVEKGEYSLLHDRATQLMLKAVGKKIAHDTGSLEELKREWKAISHDFKGMAARIGNRNVPLSHDTELRIAMLNMQIQGIKNSLLELPLFKKEPLTELIALLELPVPSTASEWESRKTEMDSMIQVLKPDLQQRLDFFVYIVSPEPKGGHEWGKKHRYDDPALLKKAMGLAIWDHVKLTMHSEKWSKAQRTSLLNKFCTFASGPKGNDEERKAWALKNAAAKPESLCKAIWTRTSQMTFQNFFYGSVIKNNPYQPGFTVKGPFFIERTPLQKVREMLGVVCSQDDVTPSVKRAYIQGCLDQIPTQQRYLIDGEVFKLSKDPWKGGQFWGRDHVYDDISVLLAAVNNVSLIRLTT